MDPLRMKRGQRLVPSGWTAGKDDASSTQSMLDHNNNRLIEAADILHLGGNSDERNSLDRLDSNGDGGLDASDPAFAGIKVWVNTNSDGRVDDGEMQSPQLSSINFTTGQINYTEGPSASLSAVYNASHGTVTRRTCKRNGLRRHFAKTSRVKNAGNPRITCLNSYEVCSNKNVHRHEFRKSLRRGQYILSHIHGVYAACFCG